MLVDFEEEFVYHLANQDSLEFIIREGIANDLLFAPTTKAVFQFVQHHFAQTGKIPSAKVLQTEFPRVQWQEPETTVEYVIDKLRERFQKNQVKQITSDLADRHENPEEAVRYLREQVFELERKSLSGRHVWRPGDHKVFLRNLQQQVLAGAFQGASIGYQEIDQFTGGVKDGNIAYVLARPKRQKTFNVLQAFIAHAREGRKPYFPTLEVPEQEIMLRLSCMLSGYPWDKAQKGDFDSKAYKLLEKAWDEFSQHEFTIEMPPLDERTVPSLVAKADKYGAESVIISQFKDIVGLKDWYRSKHEEHAEVALDLKRAATRPGAERPFIVEAQFNRGGDSMEELEDFDAGKVGLTDMIPQTADSLFGLFQDRNMRSNGVIEYGILDARSHGKAAWYIEAEFISRTELRLQPGSRH